MSEQLTVGLVGCGGHSDAHVRALLALADRARTVATCDLDFERAAKAARRLGAPRPYGRYDDLLGDPGVDAVILCLPHDQHAPAAVAAARAGKHILVEKPIARTLDEADAMIRAAEEAGVTLMVAHNQRFHPMHRRVREMLDEGVIGDVYCARADNNMAFAPPATHWIYRRAPTGGGAMMGYGVHRIDLLRWLVGEVSGVAHFQLTRPGRFEAETSCVTILRFGERAIGEITINWTVEHAPWKDLLFLYGEHGAIHNASGRLEVDGIGRRPGREGFSTVDVPAADPFTEQLAHFVTCVTDGREPLTSGAEARRTLAVCLAAYQSAETGVVVEPGGAACE
jgi:predicted dehydrogenase